MKLSNWKNKQVRDSVQVIIHSEPYETHSEISIKYSAKGEPQPEATVKIIRHLPEGDLVCDFIRADLTRGVDEVMIAVKAMFQKHQEQK